MSGGSIGIWLHCWRIRLVEGFILEDHALGVFCKAVVENESIKTKENKHECKQFE